METVQVQLTRRQRRHVRKLANAPHRTTKVVVVEGNRAPLRQGVGTSTVVVVGESFARGLPK